MNDLDWGHYFTINAETIAPTSGSSITIKRIYVQPVSRKHRQFCVIAQIRRPGPGAAVIVHAWAATHVAAVSRRPFRTDSPYVWDIPSAVVMRSTTGKLLAQFFYTTNSPSDVFYVARPSLCHA